MIMKKNRVIGMLVGLGIFASPGLAVAGSLQDKLDNIQISGFVDTAIYDDNGAGTKAGITLDQIELDIEYAADNVGLRFDLNVFPSVPGAITGDGLIEQGYVFYTLPGIGDEGLTFTLGKFNAPIGWELLDAPDMYQYSHAMEPIAKLSKQAELTPIKA